MSPPGNGVPDRRAPADCAEALDAGREVLKTLFPLPPPRPRRRQGRSPAKSTRRGLGVLAVAAIVGALVWLDPAYRQEHYATAVGERREVVLADDSRLTLDAASRIDVAWHLRTRRATVAGGRVLFAVAPATYRPFEVIADDSLIRVVGTVFEVRREDGEVAVSVLEGRVAVGRRDGGDALPLRLGRGEQVVNHGATLGEVRPCDPEAATAWRTGQLLFERTPLHRALAELQRYRPGPIRLLGEATAGLEISGVFEAARSEQLLDLLPTILPVRVRHLADGSVEVTGR